MTSGNFKSFLVSSIWVDRAKRQRRELKNIPELAHSMATVGQINPPVIKRDGELVAGERRLEAAKLNGWTHMSVQFAEDMSPEEFHLIELEENVQRSQLEWPDECLAVEEYHRLKKAADSDWTETKTGEMLGWSQDAINSRLGVARELLAGNQMVKDAPKFSTARGLVARANERKATSAVAALKVSLGQAPAAKQAPLLLADFHEWSVDYSGPKFNFIHCDFPYGIDAQRQQQGNNTLQYGSYDDGENVYFRLVDTLGEAMRHVVADSAHLMFWFSMDYYAWTKNALEQMDWAVNPFPLIWMKNDNTGLLPDPNRGPRRIYETAFFASRGDRKIVRPKSNAFAWPGKDKSIHMSEKPVEMLSYFMAMFVDDVSTVLDPTCGSGNSLKAATKLGAASVLGLEKDAGFYNAAVEAYFD